MENEQINTVLKFLIKTGRLSGHTGEKILAMVSIEKNIYIISKNFCIYFLLFYGWGGGGGRDF
jgi:hypothetical protein